MKAAILEKINHPLAIKDIETTPLRVGQVLVRVLVSGICGSQLHEIMGNKGNSDFLPHLMGHEGCGIVQEIGLGVTHVKPGDKVVMHWRPGQGIDSSFPNYIIGGQEFSSGKVNTLCELSITSENRITKVPTKTDPEFAALLGCSMSTALAIIENESNLKFGETVLIIGCGGVGLNLISAARLRGAGVIIGLDRVEQKQDLVLKSGADRFFLSIEQVLDKVDLVIDTTGIPEIIEGAFSKLSGRGRLILVGQPNPGQYLRLPNAIQLFDGRGQILRATQGGGMIPHEDIPRFVRLFELGKLSPQQLVTHRFTLDEVNLAFDKLKSGLAGRIIINIEKRSNA